ncbi:MAG TPA: phosphotransferase family protein [Acidimicrobiales bacterium]|nr:phosphotransferase family protein [Acidimicrobiales bacterium]
MADDNEYLGLSRRDDDELRARLTEWLAQRPEIGADVRVDHVDRPETNGVSSETLLFDASWSSGEGRFVARMRPDPAAFPIFPTYDLERQVRVMRLVGERTAAPVPQVHWYEPDETALGAPFFVMDRVEGEVPPDVMPYPFDGSWVVEATPQQRAHLQATSVDVLAAIHGVEASAEERAFLASPGDEPGRSALRAHFEAEKAYYDWVRGDLRYPVLDRAFAWLEDHWPVDAEAGPTVVSWGDARIGNMMYRDFQPVAVFDWEMATLGPRELDLSWFVFLHRFLDDIAVQFEMPGLPDFLDRDEVAHQYAESTGHEPRDFDWFLTYAALRHGTVMIRATGRSVHFGENPPPEDHEELVMHRRTIDALVAGTYWRSLKR